MKRLWDAGVVKGQAWEQSQVVFSSGITSSKGSACQYMGSERNKEEKDLENETADTRTPRRTEANLPSSAGQRPEDQTHILQGQDLQKAHSTQGHSVQGWKGETHTILFPIPSIITTNEDFQESVR